VATDIHKTYGTEKKPVEVLHGVDMTIRTAELTAIVGASGSGKTTLLQILGSLDLPDSGSLLFKDKSLLDLSDTALSKHRNHNIGFIFQFHHLLPEFTALENVVMPGRIQGLTQQQVQDKATALLEQVQLGHRLAHRPGELSGGEQQRVALARALIMDPQLLLADEPTGNLDSNSGDLVFSLLHDLSRSMDLAVVMVTHNQALADQMDRCLTLKDGLLS
jgi:lipoprotein-releasing system ATP-binding protein